MKKASQADLAAYGERTRLSIAGRDPVDSFGFVNPPIVRGSTVLYDTVDDFAHRRNRYTYGTKGNPTIDALEDALNCIEKGAGVVVTPSGLLACTLPLLAALGAGDHLLVTDSVYRPTRMFCDSMLKRLGIETTYFDPLIGSGIANLMRPNTRAVFTEAPGSQTFEMQDIPAIVAAAHAHGAIVLMDNTWATPLFFDSHKAGVDYTIQAGTKYYAGHSDVLIGTVSARTRTSTSQLRETWETLGVIIAPEDAFLTLRGIRTMKVRLDRQMPSGIAMAEWLEARPEVSRVMHPALPSDPGLAIWKRDFYRCLLAVLVRIEARFVEGRLRHARWLKLFGMGASWGGYESLITPFDCKSYRTATTWAGTGPTLRIHIGLEDLEDLKADLDAGFARLRATA